MKEQLTTEEAYDQASLLFELEHFLRVLEEFDGTYTHHLKYGDVHHDNYKDYALKLQGVQEFVSMLRLPITRAEDAQKKAEEAEAEKTKRGNDAEDDIAKRKANIAIHAANLQSRQK